MPYLHGVLGKEAQPYQVGKPLGGRDELLPVGRNQVEQTLLLVIIPRAAALGKRRRIGVELRTSIAATRLPLIALLICEVSAMACERPAVVKGPLSLAVVVCEPFEKHLDVDVVAV